MIKDIQIVSNKTNEASDTLETFYTAPSNLDGVRIDSFTAANNSLSNKAYKAYIVDKDGDSINPQIPYRIVVWEEKDLGIGIVGQLIPPGGTLRMECNAANSVYFTVSGKEVFRD